MIIIGLIILILVVLSIVGSAIWLHFQFKHLKDTDDELNDKIVAEEESIKQLNTKLTTANQNIKDVQTTVDNRTQSITKQISDLNTSVNTGTLSANNMNVGNTMITSTTGKLGGSAILWDASGNVVFSEDTKFNKGININNCLSINGANICNGSNGLTIKTPGNKVGVLNDLEANSFTVPNLKQNLIRGQVNAEETVALAYDGNGKMSLYVQHPKNPSMSVKLYDYEEKEVFNVTKSNMTVNASLSASNASFSNLNVGNLSFSSSNNILFQNQGSGLATYSNNARIFAPEGMSLSLMKNNAFIDALVIDKSGNTNLIGDLKIGGSLIADSISLPGTDGPIIQKSYGSDGNRFGLGTFSMGTTRLYAGSDVGSSTVNLSMANKDGSFTDVFTVSGNGKNKANVNGELNVSGPINTDSDKICIQNVCVTIDDIKKLKNL